MKPPSDKPSSRRGPGGPKGKSGGRDGGKGGFGKPRGERSGPAEGKRFGKPGGSEEGVRNRPRRDEDGERKPRTGGKPFGKPRREGEEDRKPRREGEGFARKPRGEGFAGDRPKRGPREEGDRGDRPFRKPREDGDRKPRARAEGGFSRGPRADGDKPFRKPRADGDRPDRGPRRDGDRPDRGPRGDRGDRSDGRPFRKDRPERDGKPGRGRPDGKHPARAERPPRGDEAPRYPRPADARHAALIMLGAIMEDQQTLADLTGRTGPLAKMEPGDRARAQRLATETLRLIGPIDGQLRQHMDHEAPLPVQNILRIATYELCSGEAGHGVVNTAVDRVAELPRHKQLKGMTNAVLRRISEAPVDLTALPPTKLPEWLRDPLVAAWGEEAVTTAEAAHAKGAAIDLTPRDPAEAATLAQTLDAQLLPTGSLRLTKPVQISALPGYETGEWWVQDAAAAIPVRMLNPRKGEKVLDLCAAPGGKTMQLAAAGARVTALDLSTARTERISENLARTKLEARLVTGDALVFKETGWDAILLDAPCSATGTIRRHPDLPHASDGSGISELIDLQTRMIDHALSLLKPGGRLIFCTCSLIPDEGEVQVDEALIRHPGLSVDRTAADLPGVDPAWISSEGGLRLRPDYWPDLGGMDGFYCAVLRRPA